MRRILLLIMITSLLFGFSEASFVSIRKLDNPEENFTNIPYPTTVFLQTSQSKEKLLITHDRHDDICLFEWDDTNITKTPIRCVNVQSLYGFNINGGEILSKPDLGILFLIRADTLTTTVLAIEMRTSDPSTWIIRGQKNYNIGFNIYIGYQGDIDKLGNLFIATNVGYGFLFIRLENNYGQSDILSTSTYVFKISDFTSCSYPYVGFVGVLENLTAVAVCERNVNKLFLFKRVGNDYIFDRVVYFSSFTGYPLSVCYTIDTIDGFLDSVIITCKGGDWGVYMINLTNMTIIKLAGDQCPERARILPDGFVYFARWNSFDCNSPTDADIFRITPRLVTVTEEAPQLFVTTRVFYVNKPETKGVACDVKSDNPGILLACGISNWTLENIPGLIMLAVAAFIIYFIYSILKI